MCVIVPRARVCKYGFFQKHPAHPAHLARKLTVCSIYLARS